MFLIMVEMVRDFTYVDDIVQGIISVIDNPAESSSKILILIQRQTLHLRLIEFTILETTIQLN